MSYKGIFCDPFKPDTIDLGEIDKDKILDTFEEIPWNDFINRMSSAKQKDNRSLSNRRYLLVYLLQKTKNGYQKTLV